MNEIIEFFQTPTGVKLITVFVSVLIVFILTGIIKRVIPKYVSQTGSRYRARKFINFMGYALVILAIIIVYSNQLTGFTVFLGVAGAGIAFALQEVIASVAGFIAINFTSFFKVGDRVLLGGIKGDVID
ncbi:MAG: mechanosensitive ion channel, partial [Maribacter sp.]|nr:mechanosensitive ion channel [Maribacter sp.]